LIIRKVLRKTFIFMNGFLVIRRHGQKMRKSGLRMSLNMKN